MSLEQKPFIGAHVSAAVNIDLAIDRIRAIGGNCVQIFSASPQVWARKTITPADIALYKKKAKEFGIGPTVIHALYLVNLGSEKPDLVQKSVEALIFDMNMIAALEGVGIVVHLGSHLGRGYAAVRDQVIAKIKEVLDKTPKESVFLIENSAGQQGKLVSKLDEIQDILQTIHSPRLGWCVDTCHAHAAGYRLVPGHGSIYSDEPFLFDELTRLNMWDSLKVVHVNESRDDFFSCHDRHENLGQGKIGDEVLRKFLHDERIKNLPLILEVPGMDKKGPDAENVKRLRALVET